MSSTARGAATIAAVDGELPRRLLCPYVRGERTPRA